MSKRSEATPMQGPSARDSLGLSDMQKLFSDMRGELLRVLRRRTGDPEIAADLTQDVFVKLSGIGATIPDRRRGRTYIFRMAGNLAIDHGRTEVRRAEILTGSQVLFENMQVGPHEIVAAREQLREMEAALAELPERCREVLVLSQINGLKHKEIADRLGVSVSLVEKYRLRAIRHCRARRRDEAG